MLLHDANSARPGVCYRSNFPYATILCKMTTNRTSGTQGPQAPAGGHILQVETGLQQLMGDRALYLQILRRFRQRYPDSASQARAALAAGDADGAQRAIHTLKGAAGMIGAQQVYVLATAIEPACTGPAAACNAPLAQLEQALRSLMLVIDGLLDGSDADSWPAPGRAETAQPAANMLLQHLARLLEEGDGAAIDLLEQSATALAGTLGVAVFEEVSQAAHQFDFEAALATLQAAIS
jgi:HPt (histidine-containing phosphotransfer) domain-containing protein